MGQRGRTSSAELAIARPDLTQRLAPPAGMAQYERSVWLRIVNSQPADWFGPEHTEMLRQYCRHTVNAELIAQQLSAFDPQWMADEDGLKRYDLLCKCLNRETAAINSLARGMRLTQQSMIKNDKVKKKPSQGKPWQRNESPEA
jgi:beta-galactosidase/beta-glucuronidase